MAYLANAVKIHFLTVHLSFLFTDRLLKQLIAYISWQRKAAFFSTCELELQPTAF